MRMGAGLAGYRVVIAGVLMLIVHIGAKMYCFRVRYDSN